MRLAALIASGLLVPVAAHAQTVTDITASDLMHRVEVLADDSMLGRDAGRIGNVRATNYIARELTRLGFVSAGSDGWFQTIPLVERTPTRDGEVLVGSRRFTELLALRPIGGNPFGGNLERRAVRTIYGGRIGGTLVDASVVAGMLVVFDAPGSGPLGGNVAGSGGTLAEYAGAAGIVITGLDRITPAFRGLLQATRVVLDDPAGIARQVPAALIGGAIAEAVFGGPTSTLQPGTRGADADVRFGFADKPVPEPARNVVAVLPGTDTRLRGQFVAIGSHSDHVGVGAPVDHDSVRAANVVVRPLGANGPARPANPDEAARILAIRDSLRAIRAPRLDSIFNGADDDASGTAVALEMAEYFRRHPTRRSLLFVFHTAEEKGLFGAAYFTDHPTVDRDSIVAQINMDQVSRGGPGDVAGSAPNTVYLLGTRRLSTSLGDLVEQINARPEHRLRLDFTLDADGHPANGYCRSDHYMYARYGIPIVFLSAGWHRDYHMVSDEPQYTQTATMLAIGSFARDIVREVADADRRPFVDHPKPDPRAPCRQ